MFAPGRAEMDGVGDHILADPGLAEKEQRAVRRGHQPGQIQDRLHRRAGGADFVEEDRAGLGEHALEVGTGRVVRDLQRVGRVVGYRHGVSRLHQEIPHRLQPGGVD